MYTYTAGFFSTAVKKRSRPTPEGFINDRQLVLIGTFNAVQRKVQKFVKTLFRAQTPVEAADK